MWFLNEFLLYCDKLAYDKYKYTCPSTDLAVGVVPAHRGPQTRVQAHPGAVQAASPVRALRVRAAVAGGGVAEADK